MYPHLKVIWSFGGWTWSGGFGEAAANPEHFADSCYDLVFDSRWADVFDGIDIDWEYPNDCGLSCDNSGFDGYPKLMKALRSRFGDKLVTSAIGAGEAKLNAADYGGAAQYVDFYMLMTYDFFGAFDADGPTAPHSALYNYDAIPIAGFYSDNAVQVLRGKDVPSDKILLGIGFYGRGWSGVTQSAPGGAASGAAKGTYEQGIEDYKKLKNTCPANGEIAGTAYAHCGNEWWSYDTPSTINGKMDYVKQQGLGGAFFWELSGDTSNGELINAIDDGLDEPGKKKDDDTKDAPDDSDTQAPSIPNNVEASAVENSRIDLAWEASTDDVQVEGYRIFRDGVEIGTTTGVDYSDVGLTTKNKRHGYTVAAFDAAGNESVRSDRINVTTKTSGRGIWFWKGNSNNSQWGTLAVIGDSVKEDAAIADFAANDVQRVYGSYGSRVVAEPAVIAAWNSKLYAAGMESQALLGNVVKTAADSVLLSAAARNDFFSAIDDILEFNNHQDRLDREKFAAVHLDIEPQVLKAQWDNGSAEDKRDLLIRLEQVLADIRTRLDEVDASIKLYADIGHYFEKLPPGLGGSGKVGWLSKADRDQWLYNLASVLDNISIMAYGTDNIANLASRTGTEREFFAEAEIGLNAKEIEPVATEFGFSSVVLEDIGGFNQTMDEVEAPRGPIGNITAIHSYRYLKYLPLT
jgi:hypothetical protein